MPIDDIDLVPGRTQELLADLRILSSIPGIVALVSLDQADLQRHLEADLARSYGVGIDAQAITILAKQQIEKTISANLTVEPTYLPKNKRYDFVPISKTESVGQKIAQVITALDPTGVTSKEVLAWLVDESDIARGYKVTGSAWLPETPRALETIWRTCDQFLVALEGPAKSTTGIWLKRLVELIGVRSGFSMSLDVSDASTNELGQLVVSAEARWSLIDLYSQPVGRWHSGVAASALRIQMKEFGDPVARVPNDAQERSNTERTSASPSDASALLLVEDILRLPSFQSPPPIGPTSIGPVDYWPLQSVRMLDEATDDIFFSMPIIVGGYQMSHSRRCWNGIVSEYFSSASRPGSSGERLDEFIRDYVTAVVTDWYGQPTFGTTVVSVLDEARQVYLESVAEGGGSEDFFKPYTTGKAYCHWYEYVLPMMFHDLLIPGVELEPAIDSWVESVAGSSRKTEKNALDELRGTLRSRIENCVSDKTKATDKGVWFFGYASLLRAIDSTLLDQVRHHEDKYAMEVRRSRLGRSFAGRAVEVSNTQSQMFGGNRSNAAGDYELDVIYSVCDRLRRD